MEDGVREDEDGYAVAEELEAGGGEVLAAVPFRLLAEHGGEGGDDFAAGHEFEVGRVCLDALEAQSGAADQRPGCAVAGFFDDAHERAEDGVLAFGSGFVAQRVLPPHRRSEGAIMCGVRDEMSSLLLSVSRGAGASMSAGDGGAIMDALMRVAVIIPPAKSPRRPTEPGDCTR